MPVLMYQYTNVIKSLGTGLGPNKIAGKYINSAGIIRYAGLYISIAISIRENINRNIVVLVFLTGHQVVIKAIPIRVYGFRIGAESFAVKSILNSRIFENSRGETADIFKGGRKENRILYIKSYGY